MRKIQSSVLLFLAAMFCLFTTVSATAQTTLSATTLSFGSLAVGVQSNPQSVTLTNTSGASIAISSIAVTGTNTSSFTFSNTCGTTLAAGANCTIQGTFTPAAQGPLTASVKITDGATNSPQSIALSGTGLVTAPTLSATSLTFGRQLFGTATASQVVTLTNNGTAALAVTGISMAGANPTSFVLGNTCAHSVAVGANCTITVTLKPAAVGALSGTVTIVDDAGNSPQTIAVTGTGIVSAPTLSATSLTFAAQPLGTTSATQQVTLTNPSAEALAISSIAVTGTNASSFASTNNCGTSLAAGASCTIQADLAPTAAGALTAAITITDYATGSPQSISLSGAGGVAAPTLSATSLTFGRQLFGTATASQVVTLTNNAATALSVTGISMAGANPTSFVLGNTCAHSVAAAGSCTITVTLKPAALGALSGTVTIVDGASNTPQTIAVTGTGIVSAPTLSATSLAFGGQALGTTSATQQVTLTNPSAEALDISSIAVTGTNASSFASTNNC